MNGSAKTSRGRPIFRVIGRDESRSKKARGEGLFREDLYFRLNVIAVEMPPLRSRDGDLIRFAGHYEKFFAEQCARNLDGLSPEAVACIRAYSWPGNLRELRNAIERAVILAKSEKLFPEDFQPNCEDKVRQQFPPVKACRKSVRRFPWKNLRKHT